MHDRQDLCNAKHLQMKSFERDKGGNFVRSWFTEIRQMKSTF